MTYLVVDLPTTVGEETREGPEEAFLTCFVPCTLRFTVYEW